MNIYEAISWLQQRGKRTSRYSLDRMRFVLDELKNPQRDYASIIIGGTNGKGSVTAIIEAIMKSCPGYVSGSLTSPHLIDIKERIKLMGQILPDKYWVKAVERLKEISKVLDKDSSLGPIGFFEAITAVAFWAFAAAEIDLAILEVGLGGRFDSTNTAEPECSVITNIGTDHQEFLGASKLSIAREKLGILRKNRPLITSEKSPEILAEFQSACAQKKSQLIIAEQSKFFSIKESRPDGWLLKTIYSDEPLFYPMSGAHQLDNLAAALEAVERLKKNGFEIPNAAIAEGIQNVKWPGRLQFINTEPPVLLDGAHNAEGCEALVAYLSSFELKKPLNIIFGGLKDKPVELFAEKLKPFGAKLCFTAPKSTRALTIEDFEKKIKPFGWQWFNSLSDAYEECKKDAGTILITGSIYLVAEALRFFEKDV